MSKGASPVVAILLLIVITVALAISLYLWVTGRVWSTPRERRGELLKVEAVEVSRANGYTVVRVYVRNMGDSNVTVNAVYLVKGSNTILVNTAYSTSSPPIWGGDTYWVDRRAGEVKLNESGLVFYEDFRDGYDPSQWVTVSTLEPDEQGSVSVDPDYGLVLTISRSGTSGVEKYGLRLKNPLSIGDGEFVAEYETAKLSGIGDDYLVEVYFSQYATTGNPHFLSQFVATYIKGWYPPITYSTATIEKRDRYGNEWGYGFANYQSCGRWEARFVKDKDRVYVYYNGSYIDYLKWFSEDMYTSPYVYLDIGIWSGESGTYSVAIFYLKIYESLYVNVTGLEAGWKVMVVCGSSLKAEKTSSGSYLLFSRSELGSYPLKGCHILVVPSPSGGGGGGGSGFVIQPGEVRAVTAVYSDSLGAGSYVVKVSTLEGVEAVGSLVIRG
ncbi:MAG: hypothetical protein DRK00_10695 [Thermoprotei archaeon]|nr:MAG: hypothetical protein DRK00_10695 [Thermoprotei archaeon]